jgi:hypothetical protein
LHISLIKRAEVDMVFEQIPFPRKKFSPINQVFIANLFIRVLLNEETCDRY